MRIILTDGTELNPIIVTGAQKYVQGTNRDALTFVFAETSMDELDAKFTEENCEIIKIIDEGTNEEYIHKGYVIRTELTKKLVVTEQADTEKQEVNEVRVTVTMAQRTYTETQMANLTEQVVNNSEELTYTQLALAEVYESMIAMTVAQ